MDGSQPQLGVLMVGSVPLSSSREVFTKLCEALPGRLYSIPDGETGDRWNFIGWQLPLFPLETRRLPSDAPPLPEPWNRNYNLASVQPTEYGEAAVRSYADFSKLKEQQIIGPNVRFQISLPTPFNAIIGCLKSEVQMELEPLYEQRLRESVSRIVQNLPSEDIVIQWDLCFEVTALEFGCGRLTEERYKAYFSPAMPGILDRIHKICHWIPENIHIAFHLCYGDLRHKHFIEPENTGLVVELANNIIETISKSHVVEWIHIPVPRNRIDQEYFAQLNSLKLDGSRLYLGLVHANDEIGTDQRIAAARAAYPHPFGVATECGLGRTPREEIDSILTICKNVTASH